MKFSISKHLNFDRDPDRDADPRIIFKNLPWPWSRCHDLGIGLDGAGVVSITDQLAHLLAGRMTQKVLNRFSLNSVEMRHVGHGRNNYVLVVIRITLR